MKSKTKVQIFRRRFLAKVHNLRLESPGPLLAKHSKSGKGRGKTVGAVSEERRLAAKEEARHDANFVRDLKIQRGRQMAHWFILIVVARGFGSGPPSPKPLLFRLRLLGCCSCCQASPFSWGLVLLWGARWILLHRNCWSLLRMSRAFPAKPTPDASW